MENLGDISPRRRDMMISGVLCSAGVEIDTTHIVDGVLDTPEIIALRLVAKEPPVLGPECIRQLGTLGII